MTKTFRSICPFCSMGCSMLLRPGSGAPYVGAEDVPTLDYDADGPFNRGSLCGKGNMTLELLSHPTRLESPRLGGEPAAWDDALAFVTGRLELVRREAGPRAIGIIVGPYLTNEEAKAAVELGKRLGTPNVDGGQPEDRTMLSGAALPCASPKPVTSIEEIEAMTGMLLVGDVFATAPCISKSVLQSRYDQRRNVLGTLSGTRNRTTWFGKPDLRCLPSREAAGLAVLLRRVLAREGVVETPWAESVMGALDNLPPGSLEAMAGLDEGSVGWLLDALLEGESGVILASGFGAVERPDLAAGLAALLAEATGSRFLTLCHGPNSLGVRRTLMDSGYPDPAGLTAPEMVEAAVTGDLRALLVFGCDPMASLPGALPQQAADRLQLIVATAPLPGESTTAAHAVLPAQTWGEKAGTTTNAFGADQALESGFRAPGGARTDLEILQALTEGTEAAEASAAPPAPQAAPCREAGFFDEVELYFRLEHREMGAHEVGTHILLPEASPSHSGDGWLTRALSWPQHEAPNPELVLSAEHAKRLGIRNGDRVHVRSRASEAILSARVEARLPDQVVLAPPHEPAIRHLMRWRIDPALRDLDLRPCRVSVEPAGGNGHA